MYSPRRAPSTGMLRLLASIQLSRKSECELFAENPWLCKRYKAADPEYRQKNSGKPATESLNSPRAILYHKIVKNGTPMLRRSTVPAAVTVP